MTQHVSQDALRSTTPSLCRKAFEESSARAESTSGIFLGTRRGGDQRTSNMANLLGDDIDQPEVDPAADFLAREQDDLAELGEDFGEEQPSEDNVSIWVGNTVG